MNSLLSATKISSISTDLNAMDGDHIDDIEKLLSLVDLIVSTYNDFLIEIHVAPMSLIQDKLTDIKKLKFYLVYNSRFVGEEFTETKCDCSDFIKSLLSNEFAGIENNIEVLYYSSWQWKEPTLCLYSMLGNPRWEDIPEDIKLWIKDICVCMDLGISITYYAINTVNRCIFLHFRKATDRILYNGNFDIFKDKFRLELTEKKSSKDTIYYVPLIGLNPLNYNLPYLYIDKNSEFLQENFCKFEE